MKAIILSAGQGKRLLPLTAKQPKAALRVGEKSVLEWQLQELAKCEIEEALVVTGFGADQIEEIIEKNLEDVKIILNAGLLEKKSKVRNLFEKSKKLICIACYQDSDIDLKKIASSELARTKIKLSYESVNLLIERASGDRNNLRNEINKLISLDIFVNDTL